MKCTTDNIYEKVLLKDTITSILRDITLLSRHSSKYQFMCALQTYMGSSEFDQRHMTRQAMTGNTFWGLTSESYHLASYLLAKHRHNSTKLRLYSPIDTSRKRQTLLASLKVCNRRWHLPGNPELLWHPARLIKEGGCVDLSMGTMNLKDSLVLFGSALTRYLFLLSLRIIMLCHCSSTITKEKPLVRYHGTIKLPLCADVSLNHLSHSPLPHRASALAYTSPRCPLSTSFRQIPFLF